jgi:hypothetical protein
MHAISLLLSFVVFSIIPNFVFAVPEPAADKESDHDHDKQKCLSDYESRDIIERYINNFEAINEASINRTFTEDFTYESDSTNFLLRSIVSKIRSTSNIPGNVCLIAFFIARDTDSQLPQRPYHYSARRSSYWPCFHSGCQPIHSHVRYHRLKISLPWRPHTALSRWWN